MRTRFESMRSAVVWLMILLASSVSAQRMLPSPQSVFMGLGITRPNFLIILTDDQRYETLGEFMPQTQARIFDQGVQFTRCYTSTPLCNPSRASLLTGLYAHNHGVHTNPDLLPESTTTVMEVLQANGYYTGQIGKYLNSWDGTPRPEFDFWVGEMDTYEYLNPLLNVNGSWIQHTGYYTHIIRDYALQFLTDAAHQTQPFALIFAPHVPHQEAIPAPGDEGLYSDLSPFRPPNYNEADVSDKPNWLRNQPLLSETEQLTLDRFRKDQLRTLWSLDQAIGSLLDHLQQQGRLNNTVIFYISDNGYFWGEHRLDKKNRVYEEVVRMPFAIRYPPLTPVPRSESRLVSNIDLAPTIYQLARVAPPPGLNGRSLVSLLLGNGTWREDLLIEGWPGNRPYAAAHTGRYVYVETINDRPELYDLQIDPYQLLNRIGDPNYASVLTDMQARLNRLRGE